MGEVICNWGLWPKQIGAAESQSRRVRNKNIFFINIKLTALHFLVNNVILFLMSKDCQKIFGLILVGFLFLSLTAVVSAYEPVPTADPGVLPPSGSCGSTEGCGGACSCGSFWCGPPINRRTYICCTPDCATGGTSDNRSCWQEPQCDNVQSCEVSTQCNWDSDNFHQCGDLSGVDDCAIFPHCDNGSCWFECRCGGTGTGDEPDPPSGDNMDFYCEQPVGWPAQQITDDTGQATDVTEKAFKLIVRNGSDWEDIQSIWFGIWPEVFPETSGPNRCSKSPTKYAGCGGQSGDDCEDEFSLIDDYTGAADCDDWSDTGRPGFFGVQVTPDYEQDGHWWAIYNVFNQSPPESCPYGGSGAVSGNVPNSTGTAVLLGLNENTTTIDGSRMTFIEPDPANPTKNLIVWLRIKFTGKFSYLGHWQTFMMVKNKNGDYQCDSGAQYELVTTDPDGDGSDCGLTCATYDPTCSVLSSPTDNATISLSAALLTWDETLNWGTDCVGGMANDEYRVYVKEGNKQDLGNPDNRKCIVPRGEAKLCDLTDLGFLESGKTYFWTAIPYNDEMGCTGSPVWKFTVIVPGWFQTRDGDVHSQGSLNSPIPDTATDKYLSLVGLGGYPGVVSYNGADADFGEGSASQIGWLAKSGLSLKSSYYDYFYSLLDSPTVDNFDEGSPPSQTGVYYQSGDVIAGNWQVTGGNKIIVLVNGNLAVTGKITVEEGSFLAMIVKGSLYIKGTLEGDEINPVLAGVYLADGQIMTDCAGLIASDCGSSPEAKKQFVGAGMFIASNFDLGRDLGNDNDETPAESFIYRPDLWINSPSSLWQASHTWQELAP